MGAFETLLHIVWRYQGQVRHLEGCSVPFPKDYGKWTQPPSCYKTAVLMSVEPESSLKMGLRILNGMSTLENAS